MHTSRFRTVSLSSLRSWKNSTCVDLDGQQTYRNKSPQGFDNMFLKWYPRSPWRVCVFEYFFKEKHNSMLACRVVWCSYQSYRRTRVCILHQSDCRIKVCISHQSDCCIMLCISHQSYRRNWISCTNHSVWILFSCKWSHRIWGPCTKNDVNQKFWAYFGFIWVVVAFAEIGRDLSGYLRCAFLFIRYHF